MNTNQFKFFHYILVAIDGCWWFEGTRRILDEQLINAVDRARRFVSETGTG